MPHCPFKFRELEWIAGGKQFGRLDAPTGEDELLAHLTHKEAHQSGRYGASTFLFQGTGGGRGKLGVAHGVGTDRVDRSGQGFGRQGKLNDGSQFVASDPARPLLPFPGLKTHCCKARPPRTGGIRRCTTLMPAALAGLVAASPSC